MAKFRITAPDGKTYDVSGPEGSTAEQALAQVQAQYAARPITQQTSEGGPSDQTQELRKVVAEREARGKEPKANATQPTFWGGVGRDARNAVGGLIGGAAQIGVTLTSSPQDLRTEAGLTSLTGGPQLGLKDLITGGQPQPQTDSQRRREDMVGGLKQLGVDPNSGWYKAGSTTSGIAGTAGVGGVFARGLEAVPIVARSAPGFIEAVRTGGIGQQSGNVLTRMAGGATTGAASAGLVDPKDAALGAGVGGTIPMVGGAFRAAGPILQQGLDAFGRFTEAGRRAAAVRLLQRAGVDQGMADSLGPVRTASGASPVLSERIPVTDPNTAARVAHIQDALRTANPDFAAEMATREVNNNAARVGTLRGMAGADGGRDFAVANRAGTSGPMYQEAFAASPEAARTSERELRVLLRTPALREAAAQARTNAANTGANVGPSNASGSVEGLHQMKMALDDMISKAKAKATGSADNEAAGLVAAQRRLVGYIESVSPEYASARGVHRQMSAPINRMDVAGHLLERGTAATSDLGGMPRLMPDAYARQLGGDNALVRAATGRDLGGLDNLMEPGQLTQLRAIGAELDRQAAVGRAANGPGSATAKRQMQGQHGMLRNTNEGNAVIRTLLGAGAIPTGGGSLLALAGREVSGNLTRRTQEELGNLLLNPEALSVLMRAQVRTLSPAQRQLRSLAEEALRRAPVAAGAGD